MVTEDDGLGFSADGVAVVTSKHVHFALVNTKLADIRLSNVQEKRRHSKRVGGRAMRLPADQEMGNNLEEKDVCALHDRIQDLRCAQQVFFATHNLAAFRNASDSKLSCNVQRLQPVLFRAIVDFLIKTILQTF